LASAPGLAECPFLGNPLQLLVIHNALWRRNLGEIRWPIATFHTFVSGAIAFLRPRAESASARCAGGSGGKLLLKGGGFPMARRMLWLLLLFWN
jgi:hypothetical protein